MQLPNPAELLRSLHKDIKHLATLIDKVACPDTQKSLAFVQEEMSITIEDALESTQEMETILKLDCEGSKESLSEVVEAIERLAEKEGYLPDDLLRSYAKAQPYVNRSYYRKCRSYQEFSASPDFTSYK